MINNPHFNSFKMDLPPDFFKSAIIENYNEYLIAHKRNITNISDLVNFSIQTVTLPSLGFEPIVQQKPLFGGTVETGHDTVQPKEKLLDDKTFVITFKHLDGFTNYFLMFEHYISYQQNKNGDKNDFSNIPPFQIHVFNIYKEILFTFEMTGVQFIGMDALELSKASIHNEFTTFSCNFRFDSYRLLFHTPEQIKTHD